MPLKRSAKKRAVAKAPASTAWYDKKYSVAQLAKKAWDATRYIKGMINCEKHYKDTTISETPLQAGTITHLTSITQGDDQGQRQGNSILMRSIYADLSLSIGAGGTNSQVRVAIVLDTMNTGTAPTVAQIYQTVGTVNAVNSPLNRDNAGRFSVLFDRRVSLNNVGKATCFIRKYLKTYHHIKYTGSAGTDEFKNNVWLVCLCNEATVAPAVTGICSVGFYDN